MAVCERGAGNPWRVMPRPFVQGIAARVSCFPLADRKMKAR